MSYIDRNLMQGETIQFRTKKHLIIFFFPIVWIVFCIYASAYMLANPILTQVEWVPWVLAVFFWGYVGIEYLTSEFAVTNKRVLMREGFFHRHTNETRLNAISQVNVDQSLLGQILDYGIVTLNAFGAFDAFPTISQPNRFQKVVNEQMDKMMK